LVLNNVVIQWSGYIPMSTNYGPRPDPVLCCTWRRESKIQSFASNITAVHQRKSFLHHVKFRILSKLLVYERTCVTEVVYVPTWAAQKQH